MNIQEISDWIVQEGGIMDPLFGGNPAFSNNSKLNLKIQQRPGELASLIFFLLEKQKEGEKIEYYAEIGACAGGTTYTMNNFLKFKQVLIVDDGGAEHDYYVNNRGDHARGANLGSIHRIEVIGSSMDQKVVDIVNAVSKINNFDVLFIDAEHTYEAVMQDTINYSPFLRKGGYVIYHDTGHMDDLKRCVDDILKNGSFKHIADFCQSDPFTEFYPNGIGLTIIQKI
jgi:cephalosporin hydroxylase